MKINAAILTSYQKEYVKYDFYFPSEQELKRVFNSHDIELHYVSPHYYNEDTGTFSEHVIIGDQDMHITKEEYRPDILWVRTNQALYHLDQMFCYAPFTTVPSMRLKHIESDKYQVYQFVKDFQPKTALLTTFYFYKWLQDEFGEKLVIKPVSGSGGYGIEFYDKKDITSTKVFQKYSGTESFHLVQEYKCFSDGCPDLVEGNHDVRLVFTWRDPMMNYIRMPKSGSLKSNIADWGTQFSIPMNDIPQVLLDMSTQIQEKLGIQKNDLYSFDFAYCMDEDKWYLIEINSAPWIWFPETDHKYRDIFYNDTAKFFKGLIKD